MWDLPRPGLEPVSPALAGRFSTTVPPGKPCASILFPRSWIIFSIITLNSFLVILPISTSFSCSSGVSSCSFVQNIFLYCLILSNFLCLWSPFHSLQDCSFSCFWCLPPGGWDWSKRLVQASWWEGLVSTHCWVELGLVPLVGRAVSRVCLEVAGGSGLL